MKITLHIGAGKTGTTSIQTFLENNNQKLSENKIFYTKNLDNICIDGFSTSNINSLENLDPILEHLAKFLHNKETEHFIWSLESLLTTRIELIERIKKFLNYSVIEIVVFVRRQDYWYESAFYQWGWKHKTYTGNYLINFDQFFNNRLQLGNYKHWIDNWASVFGRENIKIQAFENEQMPKGLIKTFIDLINLPLINLETTEIVTYKNLGHYVTQFIGIYNSIHKNPILNQPLIELFQQAFENSPINNQYNKNRLLSPSQRINIINYFSACNKSIATEYLNRKAGILFFEPMPLETEEWSPIEDLDLYKAIPILVELIMNQENKLKTLKLRIDQIENKLNSLK